MLSLGPALLGAQPLRANERDACPAQISACLHCPTPQTCRFPGLDLPKCAGFQILTPQNVQVSRFGPPKMYRFPGLDPPKCAGFQVWTPKTLTFLDLSPLKRADFQPQTVQVSRFGPTKCARLQVWILPNVQAYTFWGGPNWKPAHFGGDPNLETYTNLHTRFGQIYIWVQTWKPTRFGGSKPGNVNILGGPNLETCTFGVSKPGNLYVLGGPNLETCTFGGSKPGNLQFAWAM